jgi:methylated-DNA-[protein]-cysteine S-methyltransferase
LKRRFPDAGECAPPSSIRPAIDGIIALLSGVDADLSGVALDLENVPEFRRRVYEVARKIPPGATVTYGEIAERIGAPGAARDVGEAMGKNPVAIISPCHRVVAANGKLGGFSANGGIATKRKLLGIEGRHARGDQTLFGSP